MEWLSIYRATRQTPANGAKKFKTFFNARPRDGKDVKSGNARGDAFDD